MPEIIKDIIQEKRQVFVVNLSDKDYSSAEKYGELVFCTKGVLDFRALSGYQVKLREYFKHSDSEDFLLFSGPQIVCAIALAEWFKANNKCNIIIWEGYQYNCYSIYDLDSDLENEDDPN